MVGQWFPPSMAGQRLKRKCAMGRTVSNWGHDLIRPTFVPGESEFTECGSTGVTEENAGSLGFYLAVVLIPPMMARVRGKSALTCQPQTAVHWTHSLPRI